MREIGASALATLIGFAAIHHALRETPPAPSAAKSLDRLAADLSPERAAIIHETSTLFSPALVPVASALVAPLPAEPAAGLVPAAARVREVVRRHPVVAARPPSRPSPFTEPADPAAAEPTGREALQILGWAVPGTDLIPSGAETSRAVAQIGERVTAAGGFIAERIGLK